VQHSPVDRDGYSFYSSLWATFGTGLCCNNLGSWRWPLYVLRMWMREVNYDMQTNID
jgi:hypothetical protein